MSPFRLGPWVVHPTDGTLDDGEHPSRLEPKVMAVLVVLAEHAGQIVSKAQLLEAVWPDTHIQEVALSRCISEIRRRLGDDARSPTFIETVPKRGYRLKVLVEPVEPEPRTDPPHPQAEPSQIPTEQPQALPSPPTVDAVSTPRAGSPLGSLVLVGLVLLVAILAGWQSLAPPQGSVAVVALENLTGDPETNYFGAGITEDLIVRLSQVRGLRVKAVPKDDAQLDLRSLGRRHRVASILRGTVRREEDAVRLTVHLEDTETGSILWSNAYDGRLEELFNLQKDLANRIAVALEAELTPAERQRLENAPTERVTAYDYFLRGRDRYLRYRPEENEAAIAYFRRALELDPTFGLAQAELASALALRSANYSPSGEASPEALEEVRSAVQRAHHLGPALPETLKAQGLLHSLEGRPRQALAAYAQALELRPDYPEALNNVAFLRLQLGQWDEAGRWQPRLPRRLE